MSVVLVGCSPKKSFRPVRMIKPRVTRGFIFSCTRKRQRAVVSTHPIPWIACESEHGSLGLCRVALGQQVFAKREALRHLEELLHPIVGQAQEQFVRRAAYRKDRLIVLDIPLLFETGGEADCDYVAVVWAPAFLQKERLKKERRLRLSQLETILNRQMPDNEKRRRADFLIPSGLGRAYTQRIVEGIVSRLRHDGGAKSPRSMIKKKKLRTKGKNA